MSLEQDIKKDLEKFARNYLSQCAKIASERVYEKARYVLQEFYYSQYDPMYYARTDNLLSVSYKKVKRVARYSSAGGVNISPELMWPYRTMGKNMTQEEIIDMSWGKGWHGFTRFEGQYQPIETPFIPLDELDRIIYDDKFIAEIESQAYSYADKQKYPTWDGYRKK